MSKIYRPVIPIWIEEEDMRLIDADALMRRMYHDAFETDTDMQKWDSGCWIRYKMFENAMDSAPTIDAVEVVHGEWIDKYETWGDDNTFECSVCGEPFTLVEGTPKDNGMNFCPYCGADLRGEDDV